MSVRLINCGGWRLWWMRHWRGFSVETRLYTHCAGGQRTIALGPLRLVMDVETDE